MQTDTRFDVITGNGIRVGRYNGKTHRDGRLYVELLNSRTGKWSTGKATHGALIFRAELVARDVYREARDRARTSRRLITEEAIAIMQERGSLIARARSSVEA